LAEKRAKLPHPAAISDLLTTTFSGTPAGKRLKEGKVWLVWDTAVGKQIADRARPVGFRDGTLAVAVSSAPWMQQLNFLKKGIMEKLNSMLGEELVTDIYLKAGRTERRDKKEETQSKSHTRALTTVEQERIWERTASVSDPELRKTLADLLARHLGRESTD
jgi:hypothetical protein